MVLDQQLAATLRARIGDTVAIRSSRAGAPRRFRVGGVALVTAPDLLFQPLNPQLGPAPAQPPANVAIMPLGTFARTLAPQLPTLTAANIGSSAVPGAQTGTQWQVQAQVSRAALTGSPSHALTRAGQIRNSLQSAFTGRVQFVDNLSESLETASEDALYAEALFIMLAVPGALLALGLAYLAALGTVDRDRRELALLRARGATRRQLIAVGLSEAAVIGVTSGLLGAGLASRPMPGSSRDRWGSPRAASRSSSASASPSRCLVPRPRGSPPAPEPSGAVTEGRQTTQRQRRALWERLYLDLAALALSGLIYWLTATTGFSAVVNPDSNPTLSLSIYMFFAPALLWIGATLLLVRLRGRLFAASPRGWPNGDRGTGAPSCSRARPAAGRRSTAD